MSLRAGQAKIKTKEKTDSSLLKISAFSAIGPTYEIFRVFRRLNYVRLADALRARLMLPFQNLGGIGRGSEMLGCCGSSKLSF